MKKGTNYTDIFDDIHTDKLFYYFEVKRKTEIVFGISMISLFFIILAMLITDNNIQTLLWICYGVSVLCIILGLGIDYEDIPLYQLVFYTLLRVKKVRVAGRTYYKKRPYALKNKTVYYSKEKGA